MSPSNQYLSKENSLNSEQQGQQQQQQQEYDTNSYSQE